MEEATNSNRVAEFDMENIQLKLISRKDKTFKIEFDVRLISPFVIFSIILM